MAGCGERQRLVSDDVAGDGMLPVADRDRGWSVRMLLVLSVTMWLVLSVTMLLVWACCRLRTEAGQ